MEAVKIRPARRSDVREIVALWRQMMDLHEGLDPRFATGRVGPQAYEGYLRKCIRSRSFEVLVAEFEERCVGYVIVTVLENPPVFALGRFGFVAELCVDEPMRKRAVGRTLWEAAVDWSRKRGLSVIQLNVSVMNENGRDFWRKMGCRDYLEVLWYDIPGEGKVPARDPPGQDPRDAFH